MHTLPIIDLHCDLLYYLAYTANRTPFDAEAKCSIPQLMEGSVCLQVLALFTETGKHARSLFEKQVGAYENCVGQYHRWMVATKTKRDVAEAIRTDNCVFVMPAIENLSGIGDENEPINKIIANLEEALDRIGPFAYVSLTWNDENRFGGGNASKVGLKDDGRKLIVELCKHNIAIDFSHTSDQLAYDLFEFFETERLKPRVLASHSNYRALQNVARNLPDEIAQEISRRDGVIGLNLIRRFLGEKDEPESIRRHLDYGCDLVGPNHIALGCDFFAEIDAARVLKKGEEFDFFYKAYSDSSVTKTLIETHFQQELGNVKKLACENAQRFLERGLK